MGDAAAQRRLGHDDLGGGGLDVDDLAAALAAQVVVAIDAQVPVQLAIRGARRRQELQLGEQRQVVIDGSQARRARPADPGGDLGGLRAQSVQHR